MRDFQRALIAIKLLSTRTDGTLREIFLFGGAEPGMVIVTRVTEMSGSETKPKGNTTTEAAFEFEIITAMLGTNFTTSS